jgi:hypothetical protein
MTPRDAIMRFFSDGLWHKSPEICLACGFADSRPIREYAELTGAIIGHPGKGYKLRSLATSAEKEEAGRSLLSRTSKTRHRGLELIREAQAERKGLGPLFAAIRS